MKIFQWILLLFFLGACNPPGEPLDPEPPPDTIIINLEDKWVGNYMGDIHKEVHQPGFPGVYNTVLNSTLSLTGFVRDTKHINLIHLVLVHDGYETSEFYTSADRWLNDSIVSVVRIMNSYTSYKFNKDSMTIQYRYNYDTRPYGGSGNLEIRNALYRRL